MSNISRRKFLKGAGVAALAVAAAGVLAGCSDNNVPGTDVPDVPEVTSEVIDIYFFDTDTSAVLGDTKSLTVLKGAKVVELSNIPTDWIPAGYGIEKNEPVEIRDTGKANRCAYVWLKKAKINDAEESGNESVKKIKITLNFTDAGVGSQELTVEAKATDWVHYADVESFMPQGVAAWDTSWKSELKMESGYYTATNPMLVHKV